MRHDARIERFVVAVLAVSMRMFVRFERDLPTAHDVGFPHRLGVAHQIERQGVLELRFEQFDIDLTGGRFVAVDDGRGAFADLNGLHPRTGYILQPKVLRQTTDGRRVLLNELHVRTAQTEQTYLLGTGRGIGVRHIDRSVRLKGFAKIAARSTTQLFAVDLLRVKCLRAALDFPHFALHHNNLINAELIALLGLCPSA